MEGQNCFARFRLRHIYTRVYVHQCGQVTRVWWWVQQKSHGLHCLEEDNWTIISRLFSKLGKFIVVLPYLPSLGPVPYTAPRFLLQSTLLHSGFPPQCSSLSLSPVHLHVVFGCPFCLLEPIECCHTVVVIIFLEHVANPFPTAFFHFTAYGFHFGHLENVILPTQFILHKIKVVRPNQVWWFKKGKKYKIQKRNLIKIFAHISDLKFVWR